VVERKPSDPPKSYHISFALGTNIAARTDIHVMSGPQTTTGTRNSRNDEPACKEKALPARGNSPEKTFMMVRLKNVKCCSSGVRDKGWAQERQANKDGKRARKTHDSD